MKMQTLYSLLYRIVWPFFNLVHPIRVTGRDNIPEGGAVICANHSALSDPLLVCFASTLRHQLRPMAKLELSHIPILGPLLGAAGVIYVDRGHSDVKAIKAAMKWLKGGGKLLIFPEGTRVHEADGGEAKGGAALLATRTGTPIVPVYVSRKKYWFRRSPVVIGAPIYPEFQGRRATSEELDQISSDVLHQIYQLGEGLE